MKPRHDLLINEEIKAPEVRLSGADGTALGIMKTSEAQRLADDAKLDLVLIAPQALPPVCKIMDYGKYRYEQSKKEKEQRKNQTKSELKEVRTSLNIGDNDLMVKINNAVKFLKAGDKVKVTIRFRGREMTHPKLGEALMNKFRDACAEYAQPDKPPKFEGKFFSMVLNPKEKK